jgi:hypothetical protein
MSQFKYLEKTVRNKNLIREGIKRRLNSGNACYHLVQSLLSSRLLLKNIKKVFKKVILEIVKRHIRENNLLKASRFEFRARHSTTLQCLRLADHVTLNFNNNMSTAAVFLDNEKAFDTTWHPGLLYKLPKLQFSNNLSKLISSFHSQ